MQAKMCKPNKISLVKVNYKLQNLLLDIVRWWITYVCSLFECVLNDFIDFLYYFKN